MRNQLNRGNERGSAMVQCSDPNRRSMSTLSLQKHKSIRAALALSLAAALPASALLAPAPVAAAQGDLDEVTLRQHFRALMREVHPDLREGEAPEVDGLTIYELNQAYEAIKRQLL